MIRTANSDKDLRKFGLILSGYFLFFSVLISLFKHHNMMPLWGWLFPLACIMVAIFKPSMLIPFKYVWEGALNLLQWINTRILLGIIFFFIFSPIALFRRLRNKDTLSLQFTQINSYRTTITSVDKNDLRRPY